MNLGNNQKMSCDIIDQNNFFFVEKYLGVVNVFFSRKKLNYMMIDLM
jgi:hypothetical protein